MKPTDWLVALTRVRVFAILAGLAWIAGIVPPPGMRITLVALVLAAIFADGWLDHQRHAHRVPAPPHDYRTAA
ncbi:hypothetical protein [Streptomyces sp. NPDC059176]|uniref:hypothetical protein n=1 Tax=Streptomyces sp. NPDC059176 TaxID=3346758 RepID=UPI0036761E17